MVLVKHSEVNAIIASKQSVWELKPDDQKVIAQKKALMDHLEVVE